MKHGQRASRRPLPRRQRRSIGNPIPTPTEDTPAFREGLKAGDYITHINGELLYGLDLDEAVEKMRGAPGSAIKLSIVRPGRDKPFDVALVRERIVLRPVKWEIQDGVGIVNINSFSGNVGQQTEAALTAIDKATGGKPLGYVIDLRSNPGGLLDQAIDVSDVFLDRGEVVSQRGREKGDIERYYAKPGDMAHGLPIIVLVDDSEGTILAWAKSEKAGAGYQIKECIITTKPGADLNVLVVNMTARVRWCEIFSC